ncbi:MAG: hypothetical protein ABR561_04660 [Guyparkeria sp.]
MNASRPLLVLTGRAAILGAAMGALGGCALLGSGPQGNQGDQRTVIVYPGGDTSLDSVILPASALPAAGECRIWYPDREPGDQPPPGDCRDMQRDVPAGAVLVRG